MEGPEKKVLDQAFKDLKEQQVKIIKQGVSSTYEKLEELEKEKHIIQNKIKVLKCDLFDLKDGRLDRILERQELDGNAKEISVVIVTKIDNAFQSDKSPWYIDYDVKVICDSGAADLNCKINNSITKIHSSGAYKLKDGTVRYL